LQPVGILLLIAELERIERDGARRDKLVVALVEQRREALLRTEAHVMIAIRADAHRRFEVAMEDHLAAGRAFVPEIVRRLLLLVEDPLDLRTDDIVDPVHPLTSLPRPQWPARR